jgi:hypothetical protein
MADKSPGKTVIGESPGIDRSELLSPVIEKDQLPLIDKLTVGFDETPDLIGLSQSPGQHESPCQRHGAIPLSCHRIPLFRKPLGDSPPGLQGPCGGLAFLVTAPGPEKIIALGAGTPRTGEEEEIASRIQILSVIEIIPRDAGIDGPSAARPKGRRHTEQDGEGNENCRSFHRITSAEIFVTNKVIII